MPASAEVLGDLGEGLVELAHECLIGRTGEAAGEVRVLDGEPVDAGEEAGDAGDAFLLPVEVAVGRGDLDILAPSLMTMPWVKRRSAGSLLAMRPKSRMTLVQKRE